MSRESVNCLVCGAAPNTACTWQGDTPPNVIENGISRRPVHAVRYAQALPACERAAFWDDLIDEFLDKETSRG